MTFENWWRQQLDMGNVPMWSSNKHTAELAWKAGQQAQDMSITQNKPIVWRWRARLGNSNDEIVGGWKDGYPSAEDKMKINDREWIEISLRNEKCPPDQISEQVAISTTFRQLGPTVKVTTIHEFVYGFSGFRIIHPEESERYEVQTFDPVQNFCKSQGYCTSWNKALERVRDLILTEDQN